MSKGFDETSLERRRSRIPPGRTAEDFAVPLGLEVETSPEALRFRGRAEAVALLREEFRKLARSPSGAEARVKDWTFRVQDEVPDRLEDAVIVLPWHGWQMVGTLLADVAYGYEPNPFDFSKVGYIVIFDDEGQKRPWPRPDIGVIVDGPLLPRVRKTPNVTTDSLQEPGS